MLNDTQASGNWFCEFWDFVILMREDRPRPQQGKENPNRRKPKWETRHDMFTWVCKAKRKNENTPSIGRICKHPKKRTARIGVLLNTFLLDHTPRKLNYQLFFSNNFHDTQFVFLFFHDLFFLLHLSHDNSHCSFHEIGCFLFIHLGSFWYHQIHISQVPLEGQRPWKHYDCWWAVKHSKESRKDFCAIKIKLAHAHDRRNQDVSKLQLWGTENTGLLKNEEERVT